MIIPIGHEDQTVQRRPWVTIGLLALNVAAFFGTLPVVYQQNSEIQVQEKEVERYARGHPYLRLPEELGDEITSGRPPPDLPAGMLAEQQAHLDRLVQDIRQTASRSLYRRYGYIPANPHLLSLFTSIFMHGGFWHLLWNMLFLWLAGPSLEDRWGRGVYLVFYLFSGVVADLAHMALNPQRDVPVVGASGAIAGLMGAFLVRLGGTRIRFFYWIFFVFVGTFSVRAVFVLLFWLLEELLWAASGLETGVAVWAHIGGFAFGVLCALFIRMTHLESKVLAPSIEKKTTWTPSDRVAGALKQLDRGDPQGAVQALLALLRATPDDMDARMALVSAYAARGDRAAAGRESAKIVAKQIKARNMEAALIAFREHAFAYDDAPLPVRDQLALAAHCEQVREFQDAATIYREALAACPDDPLAPNVLLAYGQLTLQVFRRPEDAMGLLEQARTHVAATPDIQRSADEALEAARKALRPRWQGRPEAEVSPAFPPEALPPRSEASPPSEPVSAELAAPAPVKLSPARLVAVSVRAVGIDARGLHLEDRHGRSGRLEWRGVKAVSVGNVAGMAAGDAAAESLLLDLVLTARTTPAGAEFRCARMAVQDIALPQLQNEPSPTRAFQRLVATILKATGAVAYPGRDACVTLKDLPVAPHLGAYEADLLARLASQDSVSSLVLPE